VSDIIAMLYHSQQINKIKKWQLFLLISDLVYNFFVLLQQSKREFRGKAKGGVSGV
jgi:hypothetical protein